MIMDKEDSFSDRFNSSSNTWIWSPQFIRHAGGPDLEMPKLEFIIVFALASGLIVDMIQVFLDKQFGYF